MIYLNCMSRVVCSDEQQSEVGCSEECMARLTTSGTMLALLFAGARPSLHCNGWERDPNNLEADQSAHWNLAIIIKFYPPCPLPGRHRVDT